MKNNLSTDTLETTARIYTSLDIVDFLLKDVQERFGDLDGLTYEDTLMWAFYVERLIAIHSEIDLKGIEKLLHNEDSKKAERILDVINFGAELQQNEQ